MSNRATLAQLRDMTPGQVNTLPMDQIASLLEAVAEQKAELSRLTELLNGTLAHRYSDAATIARREAGKDTGTVTLPDGDFAIKADLPRKVEWSEDGLASVEKQLLDMGEPPGDYIILKRAVSETAFQRWPTSLQAMFLPHRTVSAGRQTFKIEPAKRGAAR